LRETRFAGLCMRLVGLRGVCDLTEGTVLSVKARWE
jgi:hypothetical protein